MAGRTSAGASGLSANSLEQRHPNVNPASTGGRRHTTVLVVDRTGDPPRRCPDGLVISEYPPSPLVSAHKNVRMENRNRTASSLSILSFRCRSIRQFHRCGVKRGTLLGCSGH